VTAERARYDSLKIMVSIITSNELPGGIRGGTDKMKMQGAAALYQLEHLIRFLTLGTKTPAFFKYIDGVDLGVFMFSASHGATQRRRAQSALFECG
jgi:hypothetical protein